MRGQQFLYRYHSSGEYIFSNNLYFAVSTVPMESCMPSSPKESIRPW